MNDELLDRIRQIWNSARTQAARSVNSVHVCANWLIGQQIVEAEQNGEHRAEYGTALLKNLSQQLADKYGCGFSISSLRYMRLFYIGYPDLLPIHHAARDELAETSDVDAQSEQIPISPANIIYTDQEWTPGQLHTNLSWTHYRTLLKVEHQAARNFYEIEAVKNNWSSRQLERQINALLFERLLKSRDKDGLLNLVNEGLSPSVASAVI